MQSVEKLGQQRPHTQDVSLAQKVQLMSEFYFAIRADRSSSDCWRDVYCQLIAFQRRAFRCKDRRMPAAGRWSFYRKDIHAAEFQSAGTTFDFRKLICIAAVKPRGGYSDAIVCHVDAVTIHDKLANIELVLNIAV